MDGRLDRVDVQFSEDERWLVLQRGSIVVACNLGPAAQSLRVGPRTLLLSSHPGAAVRSDTVEIAPDPVVILKTQAD